MSFVPDYFTGFEMGEVPVPDSDWSSAGAGDDVQTNGVKTGSYCYEFLANAGGNEYIIFDLDTNRDELYMSCHVRCGNDSGQRIDIILDDGSVFDFQYNNSTQRWDLDLDSTSGSEAAAHDTYVNLQMHIIVGSAGLVQTKVEGVTDILYYGDTAIGSGTKISKIRFYTGARNGTMRVDDFIYGTGGWPGTVRIKGYVPDGDTATDQFEKSAGTDAYALIDEIPPSISDYVYADADGEQLVMTLTDFAETGVTPLAVNLWAYAQKTTGNDDKLAFISQDNGGSNQTVHSYHSLTSSGWQYINQVLSTAPDGTPWTDTHLDDLEFGFDAEIV